MKLQLCIDYSSYFAVCVGALTTEAWEEISKHSESYPIYWIRWRNGTKLLTPPLRLLRQVRLLLSLTSAWRSRCYHRAREVFP